MKLYRTYLDLLEPFITFRSISTDGAYQNDVHAAASWLQDTFDDNGFTTEVWKHSGTNPLVFASRQSSNPAAHTLLVYGHYDVQPADQSDGWNSDPFTLQTTDTTLVGRGVVDNKGQVLIHMAAVFELIRQRKLAHNVAFFIEGNEETGSPNMSAILREHADALSCDHIIVSDGEIPYRPTIEASLRGGFNLSITLKTASTNLHSGLFGGGVPNAAHELSRLLAGLYDDELRVTVPGFYDGVDAISKEQEHAGEALYMGDKRLHVTTGVREALTRPGHGFSTAIGLLPTLQVSGLDSGYTGAGYANIVPAQATAKINVRTVASQDTEAVAVALSKTLQERVPAYAEVSVSLSEANSAIKLPTDTPAVHYVSSLLEEAYGTAPLFSYCGGSIPIVSDFKSVLGKDTLLISLGNDDCNMHGVNENFATELVHKGLAFSSLLFSRPFVQ